MLPTLVNKGKLDVLLKLAKQAAENCTGDFIECGVYQGGTASRLVEIIPSDRPFYLLDSFEGLPEVCAKDNHHKKGDFSNVDIAAITKYFLKYPNITIIKGWIPFTFQPLLRQEFAFCHLDLDLYEGYMATLKFIYPRLQKGGVIVFDDYSAPTCKGAKTAVDEFLVQIPEKLPGTTTSKSTWIIKE